MARLVVPHQGKGDTAPFPDPELPEPHILIFRGSPSICKMFARQILMGSCLWEPRGAPVPLALSLSGLWSGMRSRLLDGACSGKQESLGPNPVLLPHLQLSSQFGNLADLTTAYHSSALGRFSGHLASAFPSIDRDCILISWDGCKGNCEMFESSQGYPSPWSSIYLWDRNPSLGKFPGGLVVRTPSFHCRGHGFDPWSRNQDPTCLVAKKPKQKTEAIL